MESVCRIAFKEWAAVCQALADGVQTIVLRKGGIHEGREGFRVSHQEFWLFPTQFHQHSEQLVPAAEPLKQRAIAAAPAGDAIPIGQYAVVEEVHEIGDEAALER